MKQKCSYLAAFLLLMNVHLLAADTLHLVVNGMTDLDIELKKNKQVLGNEATFETTAASWVLKISSKVSGLIVTITNSTDGRKSIKLTDFSKPFKVNKNLIAEKNFQLTKVFEIVVNGTNPEVKYTVTTNFKETPVKPEDPAKPNDNDQVTDDNGDKDAEHKPGAPVYDAILLANDSFSVKKKHEILSYYARGRDLDSLLNANKFLSPLRGPISTIIAPQGTGGGLSAIFSSIGGLDVTKIADGTAKFLVKRVKQELSIAFFERFKKIIDSLPDLQVLFPETVLLLDAIDTEIYDYERYVQNLREAFRQDIDLIHHHLPGIIPNHEEFFKKQKELKAALLSGCYIAVELENRTHPGDILDNYPTEYLAELDSAAFKGSVETIQLLNASLRDTGTAENSNYWVSIKTLRQLVNSKNAVRYYLGLVYLEMVNRYGTIQFNGKTLNQLLDEVANKWDAGMEMYNAWKRYVLRYGEKIDAVNRMIKEYREVPKDSAALERYARYFRTAVDIIEYTTEASTLPVLEQKLNNLPKLLHKYFQIAYSVADLVADISKKNYSAAINEVVKIYNLVRVKPAEATAAVAGSGRDAAKKDADTARSVLNRLVKYGSFMASVSTAKNSDEVAAAIEAAALPVGSSRIKRETVFNVALNAYVGPFIGYEKIKGVDSSGKLNSYGITAPIGVSVSKGNSILFFKSNHRSSSTIFFSLVDIGALTAFRFTNDSTEKIPTIELGDIISPGIFYSHGFGKTPLSLNIGYQVGPLLRKVKIDENVTGNSYTRFSVSIVVDIPVFNLYSRSKL